MLCWTKVRTYSLRLNHSIRLEDACVAPETRRRALRFHYRQGLEIDEPWLTDGRVEAPGHAPARGADNGSVNWAGQLVTIIAIRIA